MTETENRDAIARIIADVQVAIERPAMYLGFPTVEAAQGFCTGINCTVTAFGGKISRAMHREALQSRGWQFTSTGGLDLMHEQGLSEGQIVEELLHVQIALLHLMLQGSAGEV